MAGRRGTQVDLVSIVDATYRIEGSTGVWLDGILAAAQPAIDRGFGLFAHCYDASDPKALVIAASAHQGLPDGFAAEFVRTLTQLSAKYVLHGYRSLSCGTASQVSGWTELPFLAQVADRFDVRDALVINGVNPDGHGCALHAFLPREIKLTSRRRAQLSKLSCHLAAAFRLRQRLAGAEAASAAIVAILDREGKVHHAEGEGQSKTALSELRQSAVEIARARGPLRSRAPEQALDEWKGLIAARWTLLDVCETDGRKYLVARQNQMRTSGPQSLTERERQVVSLAAMGQHNKLIAYNLGISHSTVRVLMVRATRKLGVSSRDDLARDPLDMPPACPKLAE